MNTFMRTIIIYKILAYEIIVADVPGVLVAPGTGPRAPHYNQHNINMT